MPRKFLRYALAVVLLGAAVVVFLTGLLVDRLDLHQFAVHRWAGYVLAALVAVHLAAHWRFFLAPFASRRRAAPIDTCCQLADGSTESAASLL